MALADTFQEIVDSLPDDWTDLELDLRIFDEQRYIDAATFLRHLQRAALLRARLALADPLSPTASATRRRAPAVHRALKLLDEAGIDGEIAVREVRTGPRAGVHDVGPPGVGAPGVPPLHAPVAVARVAALVPDLLFGSKVQASLEAAGHEVAADRRRAGGARTVGRHRRARRRPHDRRDRRRRARRVDARRAASCTTRGRSASSAHVEPEVRERALEAGLRPRRPALADEPRGRGARARALGGAGPRRLTAQPKEQRLATSPRRQRRSDCGWSR